MSLAKWLALRLGVDSTFLQSGVSADDRARAEAILARADALLDEHRFEDALAEYGRSLPAVLGTGAAELHVRALNGEGIALAQTGDVKAGLARLAEARALVERPEFTDLDRAEVLYRLGVCRCLLQSIATAVAAAVKRPLAPGATLIPASARYPDADEWPCQLKPSPRPRNRCGSESGRSPPTPASGYPYPGG